MSDSTYDHYVTSGPMPQQPKFKDCVWDSAKDPYTVSSFRTWMCFFGGIVDNYNVGPQLERYLDLFPGPRLTGSHHAALVSLRSEAVTIR